MSAVNRPTKKRAAAAAIIGCMMGHVGLSMRRKRRTIWSRSWLNKRKEQGAYHQLMNELRTDDPKGFKNFVRMDVSAFNELHSLVKESIAKKDTNYRKAISSEERLAITLRYLATGETFQSLQYLYRVAATTIGKIIPETCKAITNALQNIQLKLPSTKDDWREVAECFEEKWNFPHCIGAIDGKHILMRPPPDSGSYYYNYKGSFSMILMATVDADYRFTSVDIGRNGRTNDARVYQQSDLKKVIEQTNTLPDPCPLDNSPSETIDGSDNPSLPYVLVGDDAFPLGEHMMKPYSRRGLSSEERVFNYRLSRARRISENVFGILANRFRVFMAPIGLEPEKVEDITLACCCLHNFLRTKSPDQYMPIGSVDQDMRDGTIVPGEWRTGRPAQGMMPLQPQVGRHAHTAKNTRDSFKNFFFGRGKVSWQWKRCNLDDPLG